MRHVMLAVLAASLSLTSQARAGQPQSDAAQTQAVLVVRQQAVAALAAARAQLARDPTSPSRFGIDSAESSIRGGNSDLAVRNYDGARQGFQQAILTLQQSFSNVRQATPTPDEQRVFEANATTRRRQEEIDRRRLRQAEELLYRVRSAATQSTNPILHRQFDRMQENLLRVRQQIDTSPALRFSNDLESKLSDQVRPLLDQTILDGTQALAQFDSQRRTDRDLDQTKGRVQRARKQLEASSDPDVRALLDRADLQVRDSEQAGGRGDYVQARVLMNSAERLIQRALEIARPDSAKPASSGSPTKVEEASATGDLEAAKAGLERLRSSVRRAAGHLGRTDDPVTARLLVEAETTLERAQDLYGQGEAKQSLRLLKLAGRLLQEAYAR
ncbi:MAG: hypothetical protein HY303_18200 [Candidatus Wallbacteria bacterium]|nr:hypothetical protein [Candidatus Wallbacteria bacterium]